MTKETQAKLLNAIFRLLKVNEITLPIGRTNKGNLGLKFTQGSEGYEIMLDAVPLSTKSTLDDDNNIELKRMIDKYWFDKDNNIVPHQLSAHTLKILKEVGADTTGLKPEKKKRGRPKKIK